MCVSIALNYLRSYGRDGQAKALADTFFHFWAKMRSIADGAGNFSYGHLAGRVAEARDVALILRVPVGNFQAESDGLGVNSVGASDLGSIAKFLGTFLKYFAKTFERSGNQARSIANHKGLRGVHDVVGGQAIMQPARGIGVGNGFADVHGEGDDVVLDARFDFEDARGVHFGAGTNGYRGGFGNEAGFCERFGSG